MDIVNAVHAHIQNHPINSGEQPNENMIGFGHVLRHLIYPIMRLVDTFQDDVVESSETLSKAFFDGLLDEDSVGCDTSFFPKSMIPKEMVKQNQNSQTDVDDDDQKKGKAVKRKADECACVCAAAVSSKLVKMDV